MAIQLRRLEDELMHVALQDVALPARLRPPAPMSDDELMAFSEANKPCKVERLVTEEILVATPNGFENNRREAYVVAQLFAWAEADGRGEAVSSNATPVSICRTGTVAIYAAGAAPAVLDRPDAFEGTGSISGFRLAMARVWA